MSNISERSLVRPTPEQVEWADCEIGVLIHYDIQVFYPSYKEQRDWCPEPTVFNPGELNTDQWLETAKASGARYAVLTAKHGSGFCLWPTEAHEYSVKNCPWQGGKGDIVGDFIASCQKYGIRPGIYYNTGVNAYCNAVGFRVRSGKPDEQKRYNEIVIQQLTELWTRYGKIFEVWFDGGTLLPEQGGPDVASLLQKLQPQAVAFLGPPGTSSLLRWVGHEQGEAPYPCWSTANMTTGTEKYPEWDAGDPEGPYWAPAESDMPNRNHMWIWFKNEEHLLYPVEELVEKYYHSVGRNTNLLLGMVIDNKGLVPEADVRQFTEFGHKIRTLFNTSLGETNGAGNIVELDLSRPTVIDHIIIMEDIAQGERVREYLLEGFTGEKWQRLCHGISIGHKKIDRFAPTELSKVRLRCTRSIATPLIRSLRVFNCSAIRT